MRLYLLVSGIVFGVVSLIHLVRAMSGWQFLIGTADLPMAVSWVAFLVTAGLSVTAFRLLLVAQSSPRTD